MNPDTGPKPHDRYRVLLTLLFLGLTVSFTVLITAFWSLMLEPELSSRARVTARAVMSANIEQVRQALENKPITMDAVKERYLGKLLLLSDPESGIPFITGIRLSMDHEDLSDSSKAQEVFLGSFSKNTTLYMDMPIYSNQSRELIGLVQFSVNPDYIRIFERQIKLIFFIGAGTGLLLLFAAWTLTALIHKRLVIAEKTIEEKKALLIHAGRLAALGEMATGIAHELNQPLAIIRIAADGILSWFSAQERQMVSMEKKAADTISRQVDRARSIIDHMRAFARHDKKTGLAIKSRLIITLKDPVENAVSFFREQFRNHGIILNIDIQPTIRVSANPDEIEQIVVNLLSNARHALDNKEPGTTPPEEKAIHIRSYSGGETNHVTLEIEDNGKGMDDEEKRRCLEPFFTTKNVGEGTGLGLSIVHGIVKEAGMGLEIKSRKGVGSIFRIMIPLDV